MSKKSINVVILDKEYLVSCDPEETEPLRQAVEFLNQQMTELKTSGSVVGSERVAIMTALNLANELLIYKREKNDYTSTIDNTIKRVQSKIDNVLS